MRRISLISRAGAALLFLLAAAPYVVDVSAQEALPKVIRLAGPGNAQASRSAPERSAFLG
jgi:hypothetical protein